MARWCALARLVSDNCARDLRFISVMAYAGNSLVDVRSSSSH